MITPKDFSLPYSKKEQISTDGYSFYFDRKGSDLDFLPGHYIRMSLQLQNPDERGSSRFFSIASSPLEKDYVVVTTRVLQSSFKKTLLQLSSGTEVKFFGPVGQFVLKEEDLTPRIFLAGGIGITPFHSMITYVTEKKIQIPITLFVSFSALDEVLFRKELEKISEENPLIKIIYTITHPQDGEWKGEIGRISEDLIKKYVSDIQSAQYMIVGPPTMVSAVIELVQKMGVEQERIKKENFVGY